MDKKIIFIIQAYEMKSPEGSLLDICTLELYAKTESEAIERAKKLIKKKEYRVTQVIEK